MQVHNKQELYTRRKKLRTGATLQEAKLWERLRRKQLGYRFRRQHSVGWYILDFYCPEKKLVVEIDGAPHKASKEYDAVRTNYLNLRGIQILRFWDDEVSNHIEKVVSKIKNTLCLTCP